MSGMTFQGTAQDAVERLERGIPRHQLHAYLNVFNSFDGHFMGTMANVSCKGFMLISPYPVMLDEDYDMQLHLPALGGEGEFVLPFRANSRWCRPDLTPGHYDAGFTLISDPQVFAGLSIALQRYFTFTHQPDA